MKLIFLLLFTLFSYKSWGYAHFIGHSYTSCLNCHFNPFGGGQLNDYGRAVSATAISGRMLYPSDWNEEKLAYMSGFLMRPPKQNWFRSQVNYRGFQLVNNPGSKNDERKRWIEMQADVRVTLKFGENDKFIMSGDYGKAPLPESSKSQLKDQSEYRSRNHYMGYKFTKSFGVYAGLMDKVYGIRVIEHPAFSRIVPQVTQNDQTHGVVLHYLKEDWEGGAQIFAGNLSQDAELRMKGASATFEKTVASSHRLGASALVSQNSFQKLKSLAAHGRFNLKEGSALLMEVGQTYKTTENASDDKTSRYGLFQTYLRPFRGLYVYSNIEYLKNDLVQDDYVVRYGPGIQFFPAQRLELRMDLLNTRYFSSDSSIKDSWMYLTQLHIWL